MSIKKILVFLGVILVLLALLAGSVYLRNKQPNQTNLSQDNPTQNGTYRVENKEFGYSFEIPSEYFGANGQIYQETRDGYFTSYYLKTTDPEWTKDGNNFVRVLTIGAVTKKEANSKKIACLKNDVKALETPFDCLPFDQPLGENKYLYFIQIPQIEAYPKDLEQIKLSDAITKSLNNIKVYNPEVEPRVLRYDDYLTGYRFDYPAYLDQAFYDFDKYPELGISLEINKNLYTLADKKLFHILPIKYCSLSGKCQSTTLNFSVNTGSTGLTLKQLQNSDIGKSLSQQTIGDKTVYLYQIGAEGEGINFYFIEGLQNKIYTVAWKYINEQVITNYKTASGFTPFDEQKTTVENIIKSLNFQVPLNQI